MPPGAAGHSLERSSPRRWGLSCMVRRESSGPILGGVALALAVARAGGSRGRRLRAGAGGGLSRSGRRLVVAASENIEPVCAGGLGPVGVGAITGPAPAPGAPLQPERGGFAENLRHPGPTPPRGYRS